MKRHVLKYVGGSRHGQTIDTDSPNDQERMQASSALNMTSGGKIGCTLWPLRKADPASPNQRAKAEAYRVTAREESATAITVTLTCSS
jgi:hypothetical protein